MRRLTALFVFSLAVAAAPALLAAQQAPPAVPPTSGVPQGTMPPGQRGGQPTVPPSAPMPSVPPRGAWVPPSQNISIEVTIVDSAEQTSKKVVAMLVADGDNGRIRSGNNQSVLNVDGRPQVLPDGRVYVSITIEYAPDRSTSTTTLNESVSLVLAPGKRTLVSQSADPATDRKVSVEVTATVVK